MKQRGRRGRLRRGRFPRGDRAVPRSCRWRTTSCAFLTIPVYELIVLSASSSSWPKRRSRLPGLISGIGPQRDIADRDRRALMNCTVPAGLVVRANKLME